MALPEALFAGNATPSAGSHCTRSPHNSRFCILDGCRGLASLGVVAAHLGAEVPFVDMAYACVMMFFVISGYCIAASADACRRKAIPIGTYYLRRLKRIYPPYFFSIVLYVITRVLKSRFGLGDQLTSDWIVWVQNLTLTQWLTLVRAPAPFAANNPSLFVAGYWSLNYEEQFYVVMGLLMIASSRWGFDPFRGIVVLLVPSIAWNAMSRGLSCGVFLELWVPFALGAMVFYRICSGSRRRRFVIDGIMAVILLVSLLCFPSATPGLRSPYREWAISSVFALVLLVLHPIDGAYSRSVVGKALGWCGAISYSLYLTHQMLFWASSQVAMTILPSGVPGEATLVCRLAFMVVAACVFWYFCERPFVNKPMPAAR